jgi:hypothetical protein
VTRRQGPGANGGFDGYSTDTPGLQVGVGGGDLCVDDHAPEDLASWRA